ncbi:MAG: hypothetical protein D6743_15175 [Calditrichaeota bacterium]|nr:MAG: hypothetical protein D6743_15175 [Calditrichota bacterium]
MRIETQFVPPGTLVRPGPIGRIVRLVMGALLLRLAYSVVTELLLPSLGGAGVFGWRAPRHLSIWVAAALCFWAFPYVVNIGFTRNWRQKPRVVLLAVAALLALAAYVARGSLWSPAMGWLLVVWMFYVSAHLGMAFLLSAILATPGCEMRAFHDLWTRLTGKATAEHCCPGFLDKLDKWEAKLKSGKTKREVQV